jgi:hypothetical protein
MQSMGRMSLQANRQLLEKSLDVCLDCSFGALIKTNKAHGNTHQQQLPDRPLEHQSVSK